MRQETGKLLWRTRRSIDGRFCRNCGLATFRQMQNRTLITGWWGVISFFANIGSVLGNIGAWWKLRALAPPEDEDAAALSLNPGSSLYRRAGVWFAAVVIAIVGSVAASEASQNDDTYTPSYSRSLTTGGGSTPSYGSYSGGSSSRYFTTTTTSDTWTEYDKSQLRSAAVRAGMDYADASCVVRYLTNRYSPSDYIGQTAVSNAADYCF